MPSTRPDLARRELAHLLRRMGAVLAAVTALTFAGGVGLSVFEDVSLWRGVNWAIDIVATVGSVDSPDTVGGQIVKVGLITFGLGTLFYSLVAVVELFVAGHLTGLLEVWRMERRIEKMAGHVLICGFGRVGRQVAADLEAAGVEFVVIDDNAEVQEEMEEMGVLHLHGSASDDALLLEAGIERARAVIACVDSDAENVFITLSARELAPGVEIIARASEESTERKLLRAGADDVVSPYKASGEAMATLALVTPRRDRPDPTGRATPDPEPRAPAGAPRDG